MKKQEWRRQTFALSWLREQAEAAPVCLVGPILPWLKHIGVAPEGMKRTGIPSSRLCVRNEIDADAFPADYLAQSAIEWDKDGPTRPIEFIEALELEVNGTVKRDFVATIIANLTTPTEDTVNDVSYKCHAAGY